MSCFLTHKVVLESNSYVPCLLIDSSKALDVVRHTVLLTKLSALDIPPSILNWIIAFLSDRVQVCKTADGQLCIPLHADFLSVLVLSYRLFPSVCILLYRFYQGRLILLYVVILCVRYLV